MSLFFASLGQLVIETSSAFIKGRIQDKKAFRKAQEKRLNKAAETRADWQAFMADASRSSWKDEAWTICFILICGMCFIPALQSHVERGFQLLEQTPHWFQWACLASIGASFGLRSFDRFSKVKSPQ